MGKWISSTGNTVSILPWTDKGFKFITLDCEEYIGGRIAEGNITLVHDGNEEALKMITEENNVTIEFGTRELGTILTSKGIILERKYFKNYLSFNFLCVPDKDFYTRRSTLSYTDIDDAIRSLWKGEIENRTKTDLPKDLQINQAGEFDSKFLGTLCTSYRKDAIFALGLEGLLIKDLIGIDSSGNKEPYWTMVSGGHVVQDSTLGSEDNFKLTYDYKLYKKPEDPWTESEEENTNTTSVNFDSLLFDNRYRLVHKDYNIMRRNLYWNQRLYSSKMYNRLHVTHTNFFQLYRLGDVVNYKRPGEKDVVPFVKYIISGITYHIRTEADPNQFKSDQYPFRIDYFMHGLEENGQVLNDQDPFEQETSDAS